MKRYSRQPSSDSLSIRLIVGIVLLLAVVYYFLPANRDSAGRDPDQIQTAAFAGRIVEAGPVVGAEVHDYWRPTRDQIIAMEQSLPSYARHSAFSFCERQRAEWFGIFNSASGYEREYTGFIRDGARYIYTLFLTPPDLPEAQAPVRPMAIIYDFETAAFVELVWNDEICSPLAFQPNGERYQALMEWEVQVRAMAWLNVIDSGSYNEAWLNASLYLEQPSELADWVLLLESVRQPLGRRVSRSLRQIRLASVGLTAGTERAVLRFETDFEHGPSVVETVILMLDVPPADADRYTPSMWKVSGYVIR